MLVKVTRTFEVSTGCSVQTDRHPVSRMDLKDELPSCRLTHGLIFSFYYKP